MLGPNPLFAREKFYAQHMHVSHDACPLSSVPRLIYTQMRLAWQPKAAVVHTKKLYMYLNELTYLQVAVCRLE
jgi:hypothetical protein